MMCPCCGEAGIDEGLPEEPYLCDNCDYITDDVGEYYCKSCDIHMEKTPAWYHSYEDGVHDVIRL